jgi:hypothetical protein
MKKSPSYYAIIPANVRYDKDLPAGAKLMYGEITALSNEHGYCFASNGYFAALYGCTKQAISKWIKQLESLGYVNISYIESNGQTQRRVSIAVDTYQPQLRGVSTGVDHNNTSSNSINCASAHAETPSPPKSDEEVSGMFAKFWEAFGNKKSKKRAFTAFKRLTKTKREKCLQRIPEYKAYLEANDHLQQMHPTTWINGERWEDDFTVEKVSSNTDQALKDASMTEEELQAYGKYIEFVQTNCMELYRSECRVLSHSEYLDYTHLRSQPGAMRIAKATRYKILVSIHEKLNNTPYLRNKYANVYLAYKQHISAELKNKKSPVL